MNAGPITPKTRKRKQQSMCACTKRSFEKCIQTNFRPFMFAPLTMKAFKFLDGMDNLEAHLSGRGCRLTQYNCLLEKHRIPEGMVMSK